MPTFTFKDELSPEQQSRWDWAMAEYQRVQEANVDKRIAAMSEQQRERSLREYRKSNPGGSQSLREHMLQWAKLTANGAGDPKSALFARLLSGKAALPYPPPTSYSYPWYSVVEEPGPFNVRISHERKFDYLPYGATTAPTLGYMVINQCCWIVNDANPGAAHLMGLQKYLAETARQRFAQSHDVYFEWSPELLDEVMDAYSKGPAFVVSHTHWGEYSLRLGTNRERGGRRSLFKEDMNRLAARSTDSLQRLGNVFDAPRFMLNARITDVISPALHPRVALDQSRASLAKMDAKSFHYLFNAEEVNRLEASLAADIARFEADPTAEDSVVLEMDDWVLEAIKKPASASL